jgi:mono/diheme cytochrome c family protein
VSISIRHSERSEEPPNLATPRRPIPSRRATGIAAVILSTAFCLALFTSAWLTPPARAFSKQSRAAGAAVFHDKGCEHCHGLDGIGSDRGPDLSTVGKRWKKNRIAQQIVNGGGGMPPFGTALRPDEVKQLVDYLSAKRKSPKAAKPPVAAPAEAKKTDDDSAT